jgi:HK97 gp10 family phage protein
MDVTVKIEGLEGVEDALSQAGPKLAKRALRKALMAGGQVLVDAAKDRAPVLKDPTSHRQPGELRDAITMQVKLSAKEESGTVHVGPEYKKSEGSQSPGVYGMFVEFGSLHNPRPEPFMRPAFDDAAPRAQEAFTEVIRDAVESLKS